MDGRKAVARDGLFDCSHLINEGVAMAEKKKKVAGVDADEYNMSATSYSKSVIFWWLTAGLIYSIITGTFVSLSTVLLFLPGIFVISFASIPFFLLKLRKIKSIHAMNDRDGALMMLGQEKPGALHDVPKLVFFTITSAAGFLFPIVAAIVFIRIMHQL